MFFAVRWFNTYNIYMRVLFTLCMFSQCVRFFCSLSISVSLISFGIATYTCIQMIPSMTDKNFRNLANEMVKTCTTYYIFDVKTNKNVFIFAVFLFRWIFLLEIFLYVFSPVSSQFKWIKRKNILNVCHCCRHEFLSLSLLLPLPRNTAWLVELKSN